LGLAVPASRGIGVAVGLASRHDNQQFTPNVRLFGGGYSFSTPAKTQPSFRSSPEYDEKAWELCVRNGKGRTLFWNVL
jgi:hypothetical protein